MTNDDVSTILRNTGALLQISGDDSFRSRIYDRAADAIDMLTVDIGQLAEAGKLRSIAGIGKAIEEKILEILETGRCRFYDDLIGEMGAEILDLLAIRNVGVKTAGRFYKELGVKSLAELRAAIDSGRLKQMKRMGAKTIATIDEGLRFLEEQRQLRPLWQVLPLANSVFEALKNCPEIGRLDFTGDFRRHEEMLRNLELVAECENTPAIVEALKEIIDVEQPGIVDENDDLVSPAHIAATVDGGFPLRIYPRSRSAYQAGLLMTTGDDEHIAKLNQIATVHELGELQYPLPDWSTQDTEADIYGKLGLPFIAPELRRHADAIEAALAGNLPTLIELGDFRGDLHSHTHWSDGRHSIREMVEAAKALGRAYIAITDHSQSSTVANGLTPERLLEQIKQVREINAEVEGIEVLAGSEVDIRRDGSLDFPDEILARLDMTERVIRAIENPFVKIIGHLTGRLLGRRPGYAINLDAIISAAAEHRVILEINASPSRLDIEPDIARKASTAGVLISINTDAHAVSQLEYVPFGINVARRGWLEKQDVINTLSLEALRETLGL
jgi:DNA polymerase (family X)